MLTLAFPAKIVVGGFMYLGQVVPACEYTSHLKVNIPNHLSCTDGYAYFAPTIIRSLGYSPIKTQLYSVPPWAVAFCMSMIIATFSDWLRMRYTFVMIPLAMTVAGYAILLSVHHNINAMYAALFLAAAGNYSAMPVIICWFNSNCELLLLILGVEMSV